MKELKFKVAVFLIVSFIVIGISYPLYKHVVKSRSNERYTICYIRENYNSSKDVGKLFEYSVEGKKYENICTSEKCVDASVDSYYLCKFWEDRPDWSEILSDYPIASKINPPANGWKSLKEFEIEFTDKR